MTYNARNLEQANEVLARAKDDAVREQNGALQLDRNHREAPEVGKGVDCGKVYSFDMLDMGQAMPGRLQKSTKRTLTSLSASLRCR